MNMKLDRGIAVLVALTTLLAGHGHAANIEVFDVQTHIGGAISDVPGSGVAGNYDPDNTFSGISYAVFDMRKGTNDFADLRVTYNGGAGTSVMVNRTSNSQTLTDAGTISILMEQTTGGAYAGSFTFDWFAPDSFVGGVYLGSGKLISDSILYTTFDIDYEQMVGVKTGQLQSYGLTSTTVLTADLGQDPGYVVFKDNKANSVFNDPTTAAQFLTQSGSASHDLFMGKQKDKGASLFMFEFRDPSAIITDHFVPVVIPEPSSIALASLIAASVVFIRRLMM